MVATGIKKLAMHVLDTDKWKSRFVLDNPVRQVKHHLCPNKLQLVFTLLCNSLVHFGLPAKQLDLENVRDPDFPKVQLRLITYHAKYVHSLSHVCNSSISQLQSSHLYPLRELRNITGKREAQNHDTQTHKCTSITRD
jgi:hypothetical protein